MRKISKLKIYSIYVLILLIPFMIHGLFRLIGIKYCFLYPLSISFFIGILCLYKFVYLNHQLILVDKQKKELTNILNTNKELKKYDEIKDIMLQISYSIVNMKNMDELLKLFVDSAVQIIDKADQASILIRNEEDLFELKAVHGIDLSTLSKNTFLIEEIPIIQQSNYSSFVSRIINSPVSVDPLNIYISEISNIKSRICTPIIMDHRIYGIIYIDNLYHDHVFQNEDIVIMDYLASQLSIAIKNLLLFEKTLFLSRYDGLTKVYHRHFFDELFHNLYQRAHRYHEKFAVCMLDLNNLKQINDLYGHLAGDLAIQCFAKTLKENIRDSDLLGRYGGDEFILVFLNCDFEDAKKKINKIYEILNKITLHHGKYYFKVDFSSGISCFPKDSSSFEELFKIADSRMYENKIKQKGRS